jgi:hypothetical protein
MTLSTAILPLLVISIAGLVFGDYTLAANSLASYRTCRAAMGRGCAKKLFEVSVVGVGRST